MHATWSFGVSFLLQSLHSPSWPQRVILLLQSPKCWDLRPVALRTPFLTSFYSMSRGTLVQLELFPPSISPAEPVGGLGPGPGLGAPRIQPLSLAAASQGCSTALLAAPRIRYSFSSVLLGVLSSEGWGCCYHHTFLSYYIQKKE